MAQADIPERPEDWPCNTEPQEYTPPLLKALLYRLLRDHVHPGDMEDICLQIRPVTVETIYSNRHLEAYAESLASFLLHDEQEGSL